MTSTPAPHPAPRPGLIGWIYGHVRALVLLAGAGVVVTGVLIYTGVLGIDRLDEEIRVRIEAKLADKYPQLKVTVESAQLKKGRGIQIRGVRISDPSLASPQNELVYIDEILAACDTSLQELLTHEPHIKGLTIQRPRLRTMRCPDGRWNSMALLPLPQFSRTPCPTVIEDAAIEVCDPAQNAGRPLVLKNLDLSIAPDHSPEALEFLPESQSRVPLKVAGSLACEHFRQVTLGGWFDPVGGAWALRGEVDQLVVTPALEHSLPIEVPTRLLSLHDLHGTLSLSYEITNQGLAETNSQLPFRFEVAGKLQEARLADPRLPHPLTDLSAHIFADNEGVRFQEIAGKCGTAKAYLSLTRRGWTNSAPLTIQGRIVQLALDSALAEALSEKHREVWDRLLPTGAIHVDLNMNFDGQQWHRDITAELLNASVAFDKFPYRVSGAGGKVQLTDRELILETFALVGRQRVTCNGRLVDPGPNFTGFLDIASDGPVTLDERLLLAMDEKTQTIVRSLAPRGAGTFRFRIERQDPEQKIQPYLSVALQDVAIRYEKFPYPLDRISGNIIWQDGRWTFEKFSGSNRSAYVLASGGLARNTRGEQVLRLEFACADVPLEDDLKRALPPKLQSLWADLSPNGTLDKVTAVIDFNCDSRELDIYVQGQKNARPQQSVATHNVSLQPSWLPYRIDHITGTFQYRNGDIQLKSVKGQHGETRLAADSHCQLNPDGGWNISIDRFHADKVQVDNELLAALPANVRQLLTKLKLRGPLHIVGRGSLTSDGRTPQLAGATWDVTVDLENGSLDAGLPLEHVHGGVRLVGSANTQGFSSVGELAVDSVVAQGVQLTQVIGPLSLDGSRLMLGGWAQQAQDRSRPPRQITAKVFEGSMTADAVIALDEEGAFEVQASLTDADLARISAEAVSQRNKLTGKAQGYVKLAGTRKGKHTYNGSGVVRLRDADIYELPVMVALLKVLSVREPDKTAFNTADLDYRIQGEHIYLDRLDFVGDAITLKGSGEMDWQRNLNVQFYTMVGRDEVQLPVLRPLLGEASRNLMLITVGGTLDQPELKREAFPGLNETLQQIFPEAKLK